MGSFYAIAAEGGTFENDFLPLGVRGPPRNTLIE
jgi:hypothetical protein